MRRLRTLEQVRPVSDERRVAVHIANGLAETSVDRVRSGLARISSQEKREGSDMAVPRQGYGAPEGTRIEADVWAKMFRLVLVREDRAQERLVSAQVYTIGHRATRGNG